MAKLFNDSTIATITSLSDSDYMNTVNPSTGELSKITVSNIKASLGVPKIYAGTIQQSGTSAPTVNQAINTTGATFTPSRTSSGSYVLTASASILSVGKVVCLFTNSTADPVGAARSSSTTIDIRTSADDILTLCSFKIEIYP